MRPIAQRSSDLNDECMPLSPYPEVDVQLTSFTDYGLRALIYMASLPDGRMTSISEVTEVYGVSRNHMVKIINQLSRAGYVAVRGKNDSPG